MALVSNLGEFLTLNHTFTSTSSQKKCPDHDIDNDGDESRINNLPNDLILKIISHLNSTEFARLRCTCKSLKIACQQLIQSNTCSPSQCLKGSQHPWLLLPNHKGDVNGLLTFYDMFEGKFRNIKLPSRFSGGWCCGPCRGGWVPITTGVNKLRLKLVPDVFLVNPITGQTLTLPPLDTIPGYDWHAGYADDPYNASFFISKLDFSGPSPAEPGSIIAGLFFSSKTIAFCKVGAKSWTTAGIGFDDDIDYTDILFSLDATTLYATAISIMDDYDHYPAIQTKTLSLIFQDNDNDHDHNHDHAEVNIRFKCIIPTFLNNIQDKLEPPHIRDLNEDTCLVENHNHHGYLFETCNNKLLIVLKTTDYMLTDMSEAARSKSSILFKLIDLIITRFFGDGGDGANQDYQNDDGDNIDDNDDSDDDDDAYDDDDDDVWTTHYHYTRGFKVLSFDPDTEEVLGEQEESGNDVIFIGSGCISMSSWDFTKGFIPSNSIYFLDDFTYHDQMLEREPYVSREMGVFDINTRSINRCFPTVRPPVLSHILWFIPSF